jgi:hypothetical protein
MRTLKFIVDGMAIKQDPDCDFSGLIPGSKGFVKASFTFSQEWNNATKVAAFFSLLGREYEPQLLTPTNYCIIPTDALEKKNFKIQMVGKKDDYVIRTNKVLVTQKGGQT